MVAVASLQGGQEVNLNNVMREGIDVLHQLKGLLGKGGLAETLLLAGREQGMFSL